MTAPAPPPIGRATAHPPGWVPPTGVAPDAALRPWASTPTARTPLHQVEESTRPFLRPTGAAWVLLLLAGIAGLSWLATDSQPQLAVAVALVAGIATDALSARYALSALTVGVEGPTEAVAGRPTRWPLHIGGLRRPVALSPTVAPRAPEVLVDHPDPGLLVLPPAPRGVLHHFFVDAYASGPVGLFRAGRRYRVTPPLPVPLGPDATPIDVDWPTPKAVGFGLSPVAPRGEDLFRSVRPYQRGDERRHIHWKSTAHHGELMVRESDGLGVVALQVLVDLGPPGATAELVAGVAAYVAEEAVRRGWLVQLVTLDSASVPPPLIPFGSPFGAPPIQPPPRWQPLDTQANRVTSGAGIRDQLATAAFGRPQPPEWGGLVCLVSPQGVEWL
ncbi:MAG: hypothetical protein JWM47_191 [Acidimicrobiales bacterium]|nr:hypothetical protein [Acidimicrobiales bacterium]